MLRNIIEILSRKILDDNTRTRLDQTDRFRAEAHVRILRDRIEVALGLLAATEGMTREKAEAAIEGQVDDNVPRVFVVDDEPVARRMMGEMLPYFDITEAASGAEALELLDKTPPDLVITDIKMPDMDGMTLLDKLRERRPDLPVLAVPGLVEETDLDGRIFDGYLPKPLKINEFRHTVDTLIAQLQEINPA
jgi:CheY-like chemotaxis protein